MNKVTARIRQAKVDEGSEALWLFIDRNERKTNVDDLKEFLGIEDRPEDSGNVAYAILSSEVKAIRDACEEWGGEMTIDEASGVEVMKTAREIMDRFNWIIEGPRVLMLTQRKKEGGTKGNPDRHARKRLVVGEEQFHKELTYMLENRKQDERIYCSVNARNMDKGIRNFKQLLLDNDYQNQESHHSFYIDIHNRWISAIAKKSTRATSFFLIDIDTNEGMNSQEIIKDLKANPDILIIDTYKTKNGYHVITAPYQYPKVTPELKDRINTDGLALLKY